jgi:hypothetical protein
MMVMQLRTGERAVQTIGRYYIHFVRQGYTYAIFPLNCDATGLLELAKNIMRGYFDENGSLRPVPPSPIIPNEIRIFDDAGDVVAEWSLIEEFQHR